MRQQSLMQQAFGPEEGDGDTVSCSSDTSRWSNPSRLYCGSDQHLSDSEDSLLTQDNRPSATFPGSRQYGFKKDKVGGGYKLKINHHNMKLPPIKTMQVSKPTVQSARMNFIRQLRCQVWDLQQQLGEARGENKLLKQVQHRHTMALQYFQDSEGSIGQILAKHNSETRALQKMLRETRICRDNLTRQLQATENKLLNTRAALQHLQKLSQDHNLIEREELTLRLAKTIAGLETKDRKIQDMEKNLELCQASFRRQIVTEQRKVKEARNMSSYLQEHIHQLTTEIQDREKEMEKHNIYSHRFFKGSNKKGRENKMVQTDELVNIATNTSSLLEMEYSEIKDMVGQQGTSANWPNNNQEQESLITETPEKMVSVGEVILHENTETCTGPSVLIKEHTSENNYLDESPEKSPKHQIQHEFITEREVSEVLLDEKQQAHETSVACISEKSLNATEAKENKYKLPNIRHNYTFKRSIENLHKGVPAYSDVDTSLPDIDKSTIKAEILSRGIQALCLLGGKSRRGGEDKSQHESKESSTRT